MWPYNYRPPTTARPSTSAGPSTTARPPPRAADDNTTLVGDARSEHFPESPPPTGDELPSHASSALDNATTAPRRPSAGEVDDNATIHGGTQSTQIPHIPPATDNQPATTEAPGNTNESADTLVPRSRLQRTRDRIFRRRRRNQRSGRQTPREDDPQPAQPVQPAQPPQDNDEAKPGRFRKWARRFSLKKLSTIVLDNVDSSIAPPDDA